MLQQFSPETPQWPTVELIIIGILPHVIVLVGLYQFNLDNAIANLTGKGITNRSLVTCKLIEFIGYYTLHLPVMYLTMATVDRTFILWSPAYKRKIAQSKQAWKLCILIAGIFVITECFLLALGYRADDVEQIFANERSEIEKILNGIARSIYHSAEQLDEVRMILLNLRFSAVDEDHEISPKVDLLEMSLCNDLDQLNKLEITNVMKIEFKSLTSTYFPNYVEDDDRWSDNILCLFNFFSLFDRSNKQNWNRYKHLVFLNDQDKDLPLADEEVHGFDRPYAFLLTMFVSSSAPSLRTGNLSDDDEQAERRYNQQEPKAPLRDIEDVVKIDPSWAVIGELQLNETLGRF
ncbi:unnamed protein product [Didymodactylos carnosus]|uniref:Uncharacterized protein n=1 Tax=Didymodactylos carnosus TaxID=1234261 RepID=A0A815BHZ2_9BILA|nr:unnamed protein product [Didymodactylos carnosus]CAF1272878.1 unnamed protein product [Didymodactylos carnosus]CAF3978768.1 unnamed protein product [Didymodactylos carnosus]CAF4062332.1 unnamed protein product [Didymodactylos carnosus]